MRYRPYTLIWFVLLAAIAVAAPAVSAQQITLDVQPRAIRLNESATLKLNFINMNPPQAPSIPQINGFNLQYTGQEQQFNIINGQQERRLTFNYRLQPSTTGTFPIGPFMLDLNGQKIDIPAVSLEVLPAAGTGAANQTLDDLIFAKITLPRPEVYLQERFDVELALYYRGIQIDRAVQLQNLPSTGLNLENFEEIGGNREVVHNEIYEVRRFRMRGTALSAGSFELAPTVRVAVLVQRERRRDPFFGDFDAFFGRYQTQDLNLNVEPTTVVIRSLPQDNRPDDFSGAVGRFDLQVQIQPQEVTAGEPVTVTLRIAGSGNFETIAMPPLNPGDDFRQYDPKLVASGHDHKVFEQVFIPRTDAVREIPPVRFTFFDPENASYQTITRGPYPLLVKPGAAADPLLVQAPSPVTAASRNPLGIDIVDIKRTLNTNAPSPTAGASLPIAPHVTPLVALAALLAWQKRRNTFRADVSRRRRSQAPRSARAALKAAADARQRKDSPAFHHALWQALADYTAHRCNLQAGEISPALINAKCRTGGMPEPRLQTLENLLHACDEARFAAGAGMGISDDVMNERYQTTQDILRAMERIKLT